MSSVILLKNLGRRVMANNPFLIGGYERGPGREIRLSGGGGRNAAASRQVETAPNGPGRDRRSIPGIGGGDGRDLGGSHFLDTLSLCAV